MKKKFHLIFLSQTNHSTCVLLSVNPSGIKLDYIRDHDFNIETWFSSGNHGQKVKGVVTQPGYKIK